MKYIILPQNGPNCPFAPKQDFQEMKNMSHYPLIIPRNVAKYVKKILRADPEIIKYVILSQNGPTLPFAPKWGFFGK